VTHFRTSVTALDADAHQVRATHFITRPGTLPTITIPMAGGRWPDVDGVWSYLREPAEFFGIPMPGPTELTAALSDFAAKVGKDTDPALVAASLVVLDVDGASQIVVSGTAVQPLRPAAVRIACDEAVPHAHRARDPWWRRMAARTTSRGEVDQRERWLNGRGYVDGLSDGEPLLGALVFETPGGAVGAENPEPTSVLDQLARCGVIAPIGRVAAPPADAVRVWWVSPQYETHPVAELAGARFPVDTSEAEAVPSFARWS
jgi:hypothetical protein